MFNKLVVFVLMLLLLPLLAPLLLLQFFYDQWRRSRTLDTARKAVFITGCDTGFGNMLAKKLAARGVRVFAACLTAEGAKALTEECGSSLSAVVCNVADESSVTAAYSAVKTAVEKENLHLWAIVNNAGIAAGSRFDFTTVATYRNVMNVNFFGVVAVTKAFIPLLKRSRGRVVNVASIAGRLGFEGMGAYCASKYAVEAFSDSIRREYAPFGVDVVIIEPGFMKTPMVTQNAPAAFEATLAALTPEVKAEYGDAFFEASKLRVQELKSGNVGSDPMMVVDAMQDALFTSSPKHRYMVGFDSSFLLYGISLLPSVVSDRILPLLNPPPPIAALQKRKDA